MVSVFVWAKCIKTQIYQKALNKLGEERYSRRMINHEDVVVIAFLFNTAESYKFVGKYGIFYIARDDSSSRHPNPLDIKRLKRKIYKKQKKEKALSKN